MPFRPEVARLQAEVARLKRQRPEEMRLLTRQVSSAVFSSAVVAVLGPGPQLDACRSRARASVTGDRAEGGSRRW